MKKITRLLVVILFGLTVAGMAQTRQVVHIPDIPGYYTLKCDFHMHTIFSDGNVWPTIRVDEAWSEGLDAIAITDHVEYQKYTDDVPKNLKRPYEAAKARAREMGIILIKGAEITRDMPPGHFNALFLDDVTKLDVETWREAIQAAHDQGAFVFWNHPGWRQPNEIPIWYDEHTEILENGWMHGLEIVNNTSYYPLAQTWGMEKDLTLMGNSDVHGLISTIYQYDNGGHRPMTLVFSKERSESAIKDALLAHRTAVYYKDTVYGDLQYLGPLFRASISMQSNTLVFQKSGLNVLKLHNNSDIPMQLTLKQGVEGIDAPKSVQLTPHMVTPLLLSSDADISGPRTITLVYSVENLLINAGQALEIPLEFIAIPQ